MILEVRGLEFGYDRGESVFSDVNLGVDRGEILVILGRNGAGKSTMLNCLANLYAPQKGEIFLKGVNMRKMKLNEVSRIIGYVPQTHTAAYAYTVRDFAVMGRTPYIGMFSHPKKEDYEKTDEVLEELNIYHLRDKPYTEISGGERQMVTIARVMVQEPDLILLDEPTAHLDYGNQLRIVELIRRLAERGFGVVVTMHNPDHAMLLDGKVALLDREGHLSMGQASEIITEERISDLYGIQVTLKYFEEEDRKICIPRIQR